MQGIELRVRDLAQIGHLHVYIRLYTCTLHTILYKLPVHAQIILGT